ncbi:lysosomal Pro-X carboxypeptidase-like [Anneissia japonica]|uniref:lysosomal Pro-X carboxypeptidase-like n=1 Tax=Anneissia japonica TaxID=1529436 RepID=UPI0014259A2A|nr:lysosomal Pro-X carboxypeptidase-like [Anneissia japonica]
MECCRIYLILIYSAILPASGVLFGRKLGENIPKTSKYNYDTYYFEQKVDHFNFANDDVFKQRYLVSTEHWGGYGMPILFYCGNEGDITWFSENTGFMWDIAPEFNAMIVFAEHRYYGKSMPYGDQSYKNQTLLGYLTAEQALADFSILIRHMKATMKDAGGSPVVAFGGSYGGMLAAWLRMKYPNIVVGAMAASAPIWQFTNVTVCSLPYQIVTKDFDSASKNCSKVVKRSWDVINTLAKSDEGRSKLTKLLRLCSKVEDQEDVSGVKSWISATWFNLAMVDYPYPANFLEPLPAWPVKEVCKNMNDTEASSDAILMQVANALNVYYNFTGNQKCFNTSNQAVSSLGDLGWSYQACTEMVMPMCSDGKNDMFEPSPWNIQTYAEGCQKFWGVTPRPEWIPVHYWAKDLRAASNIIFSNGMLDPWSGGGVLNITSDDITTILIPDGAHHLDLRTPNVKDPISVREARVLEKVTIMKWIKSAENSKL